MRHKGATIRKINSGFSTYLCTQLLLQLIMKLRNYYAFYEDIIIMEPQSPAQYFVEINKVEKFITQW